MIGLLIRVAGWFGVSAAPLLFGVGFALGAALCVPVAWVSHKVGFEQGESEGELTATAECKAAALEAEITTLKRDLQATRMVEQLTREASERNHAAADYAQEEPKRHEEAVRSRDEAAASCRAATPDDLDRLRSSTPTQQTGISGQ
jgi:hypothetical protein